MTFGPEHPDVCLSSFSTPIRAYAAIITESLSDGENITPVWEYTSKYGSDGTTVISSITTIATGLAVADPVVVAWQIDDVGTFPSEYVKSLVARYSIPSPASTSTPTINALQPTTAPTSNGLSTGTRVGIGVGVALAAALAGGLLIFWCLRRRRKAGGTEGPDAVISEMEDQDHTHTERKWYFGGRWRSEVDAQATQNELDSKAVHVVPGPPAELEAHEPAVEGAKIAGNDDGRALERV
ncbi:hypothetical protein AA0112_g12112 [Alternaria arborescens]|nr:hypothetical protein AA0112_g12112 [Alternaria arborescens]